jgi:hypothetical protein
MPATSWTVLSSFLATGGFLAVTITAGGSGSPSPACVVAGSAASPNRTAENVALGMMSFHPMHGLSGTFGRGERLV